MTGSEVTERQFKNGIDSIIDYLSANTSPVWFKSNSGVTITYKQASRTLSWDGPIVLNISSKKLNGRVALVLSEFSITIPNSTYEVVWIDLSAIPATGSVDPGVIIRIGRYQDIDSDPVNAYIGASHQLPIFGISGGVAQSLNGFFDGQIGGVRSAQIEALKFEVEEDIKQYNRPTNPATWFKVSADANINYESTTRTLSWDSSILLNINTAAIKNRAGLVIPAFSIKIPNSTYQVVWVDLSAIAATGSIDPASVIKVGRYQDINSDPINAYIGASHQLPIFGISGGITQSLNGFFDGEISGVRSKQIETLKSEIEESINDLNMDGKSDVSSSSVYVLDNKIYEVNASGPQLLDCILPKTYLSATKVRNSVVSHADTASIGGVTSLAVAQLSNEVKRIPSADDLLIILPSYGQSNAVGVGGAGIGGPFPDDFMYKNPYSDRLYMFADVDVRLGYIRGLNNIVDPSSLIDFQPLKTVIDNAKCGTTVIEGVGRALAKQTELMGISSKILCYTSGRGASLLAELIKGTVPYTNLMTGIQRGVDIAKKRGLKSYVPAIPFIHGEADHNNPNYLVELLGFYSQLNLDVKKITGQKADLQLLVSQPSSFLSSVDGVLGLYEAAKKNPNIHLVGAGYSCSFINDYLHYSPKGHYKLGEYFAKAIASIVVGKKYLPLMPISVVKKDSNTIEITFNSVGALEIDSSITAKNSDWGFQLFSGELPVTITSKSIDGNKVILGTSTPLSSGWVDYAMQGQSSPRTSDGIPRGQLRDSSYYPSIVDGQPMQNWCVHFREKYGE